MNRFITLLFLSFVTFPVISYAQENDRDVFVPISKYIQQGNFENLSVWFDDNLELDILGNVNECSRNQAKQIMKAFFISNTPKHFAIVHKSGKAPMQFAVGNMIAGGEKYRVTIFVKTQKNGNYIQQLKIEKDNR